MANWCNYTMKVVGEDRQSLEKFYEWMNADYHYDPENKKLISCSSEHHVFRTEVADMEINKVDENVWEAILFGDCAWSVHSCMFGGAHSYYEDLKKLYGDEFIGITLPEMSAKLTVDIEVYSSEPGCAFSEHYLIKHGNVIKNEETEYLLVNKEDYDNKSQAEQALKRDISDEEWNDTYNDYLEICDWSVDDPEWEI